MGGTPPIGYELKGKMLLVNKTQTQVVRHIFRRTAALKSVAKLCRELKKQSHRTKPAGRRGRDCIEIAGKGRIVDIRNLALGPLRSDVARRTITLKERLPHPERRQVCWLVLEQRPRADLNPGSQCVECRNPFRDAVIVDGEVGRRAGEARLP